MRILTRSSHSDFEKAHPHPPRPESSSARVKQRSNLGDGGYTLTSDRREMVTVAMRNGFAWAQRWELETSGPFTLRAATSAMGHQQRSDNVPAWSGQPHKADLSKNSPSMLLSATSEALARLRVSDLTAAAPCGPSLFEHTGFCKQGGPVLDTSQARRVSGSWRMVAGRRRSARSRGSEGLCPSPIPKTAQRSASGVLDHR